MPSKYYTPPTPLQPNTTAHAGAINSDFTGVDSAFQLVAADMALALSANAAITALNQTAVQQAGKTIGFDSTGLALVASASFNNWRGNWATTTVYSQNDLFQDPAAPNSIYFALKNYTAGVSIAADVAAGNAQVAVNLSANPSAMPVSVQNASFNAAVGNQYLTNTGAAAVIATLPAGAGVVVGAASVIGFAVHPAFGGTLTFAPNGTDKINGVNANLSFFTGGAEARCALLFWSGAAQGWIAA